jgi:hypothetical protein
MKTYTIEYTTTAGMHAQYEGILTINASGMDEAFDRAWRKLKSQSFPDWSRSMFKFSIKEIQE